MIFKILKLLTIVMIIPVMFLSSIELFNLVTGAMWSEYVSDLNKICIRILGCSFIAMILVGIFDKDEAEEE